MSASDRGGRICLPPEKRGAVISADTVGGDGRCQAWRWATPLIFLTLAVMWSWPAAIAGSRWIVGRNFDLQGTIWFLDAAGRISLDGHDAFTAWPQGADYGRLDSWTLLVLARALPFLSPVLLHNLLQVLGLAGMAWAAEAAARGFGARPPWSLLAGTSFAFCGLARAALQEGHVYVLLDPWLPLLAWAWWRATRPGGRAWHGLLAGLAWAGALATTAYLGLAASLLAAVFFAGGALRREIRFAPALAAAAVVLPLSAAYLAGFAQRSGSAAEPWLLEGFPDVVSYLQNGSANLLTLAAPTPELDRVAHGMSAWLPAHTLVLLLLAPVALRGLRGWWRVWWAAWLALLLALGPTLFTPRMAQIAALPMYLATWLPGIELIRFPARFAWVWALCGGLLAARVATALAGRVGRLAWPLLVVALVDLFLWGAMPSGQRHRDATISSAYTGSGPVLDLFPEYVGREDELNPIFGAQACFAQTGHGRPIADDCVSPYQAVNPRVALQRSLEQALLTGQPVSPRLAGLGFTSVVMHRDLFPAGDGARIEAGLRAMDPTPLETRDGGEHLLAFQVPALETAP